MGLDLHALLSTGGHAREFMRAAPGGGGWVDGFCDEIVAAISTTPLEDFTLKYGAAAANVFSTGDGRVQLNVRWVKDSTGWQCWTGKDYADCVAQLWAAERLRDQAIEGFKHG